MDWFEALLNDIAARFTGPLCFRFIVQPLIAILLGMRDGSLDAKAKSPPFLLALFTYPKGRTDLITNASKSIIIPIIIGIVMDSIAQYLIFNMIHPLQALIVGSFLLAIPYGLARGLTNRIVSRRGKQVVP